MAKLTEDTVRVFETQYDNNTVPVAAGAKIFLGAIVGCASTGYGHEFTAGDIVVGFAQDSVDNTNGSDGDVKVNVKAVGKIVLELDGITQASIGSGVYITEDNSFSLTEENAAGYLGKIIRLEDETHAVVAFDYLHLPELTLATANTTEG